MLVTSFDRKPQLGGPKGPSSCIGDPRRLEALLRHRVQVAHLTKLHGTSIGQDPDLILARDLIWCRALAEKNMCELQGEAMLNECRW